MMTEKLPKLLLKFYTDIILKHKSLITHFYIISFLLNCSSMSDNILCRLGLTYFYK